MKLYKSSPKWKQEARRTQRHYDFSDAFLDVVWKCALLGFGMIANLEIQVGNIIGKFTIFINIYKYIYIVDLHVYNTPIIFWSRIS